MGEIDLDQLRQAVRFAPDDDDARLALLEALIAVEAWQEAETVGAALLERDLVPVAAHGMLAMVYGKLERWTACVAQGQQAIAHQPEDALACFNLGIALGHQGRYDEAIEAFDRALKTHDEWAEAHYNRGIALLARERRDDALEAFERATELCESYAEAHFGCGNVHALNALDSNSLLDYYELDCATTAYKRAIQHRPGYAAALYNMGMLYGRMGSDEGIRIWNQYLEATSDLAEEGTYRMRAQEYKRDLQDRLHRL
jgi:tetratricopeptide (TPR) repeat protein